MYALGIIAICLREVFVRYYYIFSDTKSVIFYIFLSVSINICLNFILIQYYQQSGLALATSLSAIIVLPLWINGLVKKKVLEWRNFLLIIIRFVIYTTPAVIGMFVFKYYFYFPENTLSQIAYFLLLFLFMVILYLPAFFHVLKKRGKKEK